MKYALSILTILRSYRIFSDQLSKRQVGRHAGSVGCTGDRSQGFCRKQQPLRRGGPQPYRGVGAAKSVLDVSSPVAKASAAALISDCVCARATAARAVASPVCADVASVSVPTPCA